MHKQHPQTAYRKYAVLIGTIFENCDRMGSKPKNAVYLIGFSREKNSSGKSADLPEL